MNRALWSAYVVTAHFCLFLLCCGSCLQQFFFSFLSRHAHSTHYDGIGSNNNTEPTILLERKHCLLMKTLSIPANEATQRLEQAFQLVFSTSTQEYSQLCNTFSSLGGLPRAWIVKGESGTGASFALYNWIVDCGHACICSTRS